MYTTGPSTSMRCIKMFLKRKLVECSSAPRNSISGNTMRVTYVVGTCLPIVPEKGLDNI